MHYKAKEAEIMELKNSKTYKNLETAFAGESQARVKYEYYSSQAKKDGYEQIAAIFAETYANEKVHEERYLALLKNIEEAKVFSRIGDQVWVCRNCGHVHVGPTAPVVCPVCAHPQAYFELRAENY